MNEFVLNELRKCMKIIRKTEKKSSQTYKEGKRCDIAMTIMLVIMDNDTLRKGNYFDLEEKADEYIKDEMPLYGQIIRDVAYELSVGEIVEKALVRYCINELDYYEKLRYLLYLIGATMIREGHNSLYIEEWFRGVLPNEIVVVLDNLKNTLLPGWNDYDISKYEKMYERSLALKPGEVGYERLKLADITIQRMSDKDICKVIEYIDNTDLVKMLKGVSGASIKAFLSNMSERLASMIECEFDFLGSVLVSEVLDATERIMDVIYNLIRTHVIVVNENDVIPVLDKFFKTKDEPGKEEEALKAESEIWQLFQQYSMMNPRVIS